LALDEPDAFFPLLDALTNPSNIPRETSKTPEAIEQLVLQSALSLGYLSSPGALQSAQMQLALHVAAPKLEAFFQHYSDNAQSIGGERNKDTCGSWVDWYGEVVCDIERLLELTSHDTIDEAAYDSAKS
jgi:UDP-glucose:glycoprotein glucosyltransferase